MKITEHKPAAKGGGLLTTGAQSSRLTLGRSADAAAIVPQSRTGGEQNARVLASWVCFLDQRRQSVAKGSKRRGYPAAIKRRKRKKSAK